MAHGFTQPKLLLVVGLRLQIGRLQKQDTSFAIRVPMRTLLPGVYWIFPKRIMANSPRWYNGTFRVCEDITRLKSDLFLQVVTKRYIYRCAKSGVKLRVELFSWGGEF